MRRWGRRPVFLAAAGLALVGAGLQLAALYGGSYALLLVGAALQVGGGFCLVETGG
jgi:MFS family permease